MNFNEFVMRYKVFVFNVCIFCCILLPISELKAQSDGLPRGAYKMPYIRYEADNGVFGIGAASKGPSMDQTKIESEASERKYVALTAQGSYVQWHINEPQKGMTLRFTMPDSFDGIGLDGSLSVYLNGNFVSDIKLSSHFAYQYFYMSTNKALNGDPFNDPAVGHPRMRFDEVRFIFPNELKAGDVIKLEKRLNDGIEYGVDYIELEPIPSPIQKPVGFVDISQSPYNAIPNDTIDDYLAINNAVTFAGNNNMGIYIPEGKYFISKQIDLKKAGMKIQGAGIWYTDLYFTQMPTATSSFAGINGNGTNLYASDFSISAKANFRAHHRGFGGYWGKNSIIENVWLTRFSAGIWVSDFLSGENPQITNDGITIRNCRIRNTYADGINFAIGASNCIAEHCSFRNNGDDAMVTWAQDTTGSRPTIFNTFRFNTVENTYKASGLAFYGGQRHVAHHCIIRDNFGGAGIRVNSTFVATPFATDSYMNISEMSVERCGTFQDQWLVKIGAINFDVVKYDVNNINLNNIDVKDAQVDGILINDVQHKFSLNNVNFNDINIVNTGSNQLGSGFGISVSNLATGWMQNTNVNLQNTISGNFYEISPTFEIKTIQAGVNQRPIAFADSVLYISTNQTSIVIDGSRSYDPEGKAISYSWVQIAGAKANINSSQLSTVNISGLNPKLEYIFKLYVNDGVLSGSKVITIKPNSTNTNLLTINNMPTEKMVIFPNPVNDILNIRLVNADNELFTYKITDALGRCMKTIKNESFPIINVNDLEKGIYLIEVQTKGNRYFSEFVKN